MIIKFNSQKLLRSGQHEIFHDPSRFKVCAMGRRWGKSILATYIILIKAMQVKGNYFFISPTFQQSRQIIWDILKDKTRDKLAKKVNESRLEIELINGSKIFLKGGDRADTLRGVSLNGVVMDEFATIRNNKEVWQEVVRPALSDKQGWALFISSPKGRDYFYDLYNEAKTSEDWKSWQKTTLDGGNVPEKEIITAKAQMDARSFNQEYLGDFVSYSGLVAPDFDRELNKSNEIIKDDDTLIIGIDFNVNKMPCSISVLRGKDLHCLDFLLGSFNTEELMKTIQIKYPKHRKIFHTDASGSANKSSAGGQTDITIIRKFGYQVYNLTKNPNIIDRVNAFNGLIKSASGLRKYFVAPHLKKVIETLEKHVFDDNGLPNKKHEYHDDIYDALSYSAWHYSDLGKSQATKIKISGI